MENTSFSKIRVGIIGATGYSGVELIRILLRHPHVEITEVVAESNAGQPIAGIYPSLAGFLSLTLNKFNAEELQKKCDVVFVALPGGLSSELVPQLLQYHLQVIDIGGDFRLPAEVYEKWYHKSAPPIPIQQQAVYGLSEWYPQEIRAARFITNPGCYPTATLLGVLPLLKSGIVDPRSIVIDAKSGVTGAGKALSTATHYSETNENLKPYKIGAHQHTPEIEAQMARVIGESIPITFTTQLVPMSRGILSSIYGQLNQSLSTDELHEIFTAQYEPHPFVRVRPIGHYPATKEVTGSNFCDIGAYVDPRTNRVTILSVIDNLLKGAAGQAVQNLNLMMGWEVTEGLWQSPLYP